VALFFTEEAVEICFLTRVFMFGTQYLSCVPGAAAVDLDRIAVNVTVFHPDKRVWLDFTKGSDIAL
jgi:hypothetical protein